MKTNIENNRLAKKGILILIFTLAFLPRAIYPVSRPIQWYERAIDFGDAILRGDWARTYLRYHPGVPTMWISGLGLKIYSWIGDFSSQELLSIEPTQPGVLRQAVSSGVIPLAFVISLCIVLAYSLMNRLIGKKIALVGACLLALDPFFITYSKVLHVDALLSAFMLVSSLFLLAFLHQKRGRDLVLSGIFAGLALLSKSSSLFLVPYAGLAISSWKLAELGSVDWKGWKQWTREIIRALVVFCLIATAVYFVLWPAMWVQPLESLQKVWVRILFHIETSHYNPVFFNGTITFDDPGIGFYLATIGWKTTLVTLPFAFLAPIFALVGRQRFKNSRIMWLLCAYIFFFTVQMELSARKEVAYLLPFFPALDLVAAFGLVWCTDIVGKMRLCRGRRWVPSVIIASLLLVQSITTLTHHPYYGTHHNLLLGGSKTAQRVLPLQDQAEGLDLAAEFLNSLPRAQRARAAVHRRGLSPFRNVFSGLTTGYDDPWLDYRVYFVNQTMRYLHKDEWEEAWSEDQRSDPLWTLDLSGITYVWIYGSPPDAPADGGPEIEVNYQLGEHIWLKRVRLNAETLEPGDVLTVVPVWESDGEVRQSYTVFCHLISNEGKLVAQKDGIPLYGIRPTQSWRAGKLMEDSYDIFTNNDLPPGEYQLSVGMYDAQNMTRVPAFDNSGNRLEDDRIDIFPIKFSAVDG